MMSLDSRKAKGSAPTHDTFLAQLSERGFGQIVGIYDALHAQNASIKIDAFDIESWGTQLLRAGRPQDAVHVFRLAVHIYPDGHDFLYDNLGEAYEAAGNTGQAIVNYRRALAINPGRSHAKTRLEALGAALAAGKG